MTTEERVLAMFERANPVPDADAVDVDLRLDRYLHVDLQRRNAMKLIEPNPSTTASPRPTRRTWVAVGVAASVVAALVVGLIVAGGDASDDVDEPLVPATAPPTVPTATAPSADATPPAIEAARAVVDGYFAAYNAGGTDRVLALLGDDVRVTRAYMDRRPNPVGAPYEPSEWEQELAWNHAQGEVLTEPSCTATEQQPPQGARLSCDYDTLDAVLQAVDGQPIPTTTWFTVVDGAITEIHQGHGEPDFATLGVSFNRWMEERHPEIVGTLFAEWTSREEAVEHGRLRAQWAGEWAAYLASWGCDASRQCRIPSERWAAEYEQRCAAIATAQAADPELDDRPLHQALVAEMRDVPPPESSANATKLLDAHEGLLDPEPTEADAAELDQRRLDAMTALGIDEGCRPEPA